MQNILYFADNLFSRALVLRALVCPALCLLLYAFNIAQGPAPILASMLFSILLIGAISTHGRKATLSFAFVGVMFLALGFGVVPGFSRISIGLVSIASAKALAGLSALAVFPSPWKWNRRCSVISAICLSAVPLFAWSLGYVSWAPATLDLLVMFAIANLFGTLSEEWFFRCWVQRPLQRFGIALSLVITALLFGLVHFAWGPTFMMLATIAGFAYACVYHVSGNSIWAAVVLHLGLNITRVALFGL